ncbi:N-acetylmuramoyl-L-alanine amidase CwlD [Metabacillus sediminilitoris]|jgi:N-acetylmuramoyl-L-alanine amidase|uniref:N-acetylmuramoyl-L-alanine amidase CwlD n=1 Tax=Metabacillus sediminilitoris TaxID=2567941 RepID=A0A4S4BMQ2_9BACI|nr:N-acetylmuramoyl-L-alanine amidase CwlD [Metabacillus sediminilitoris]QGQ44031.1 N-acetylmuramoyl-L-alanine amidase CwlD [Metabacillus sediminilitoris]THF76124.1 N-acetylmuramoyl-L-alanine amidase CwlD [Metabacillus sediminilitoris]
MKKKFKWLGFTVGFIVLLILFQWQFTNDKSWESWNLPLTGKVIYLDPGHGGPDGGAVGNNTLEKDISLSITLLLRDYLQEQGALVLLTREEDVDLADEDTSGYSRRKAEDLKKRVKLINESEADLFLSIHLNAIPSARWSGAQTFYNGRFIENEDVAKYIQDELRRNLENTERVAKPIDGVYLLKNSEKPGALVEVGFLSNPQEEKLLNSEQYQEKVAASIYNGILRYFSNEKNPPE